MNSPAPVSQAQPPSLLAKIAARYSVDAGKLMTTLKATAFKVKDGEVTNEQMMALLIVADQYHLNPITRELFAFPDKGGIVPVVSVDGWARIINTHEALDGIEFVDGPENDQGVPEWIECVIYRKDRGHPTRLRERFREVKRDTQPWKSHPSRMLRHKALIQCARIAFGFAGIYDQDEAERIVERNITADAEVVERQPLRAQVQRKSEKTEDKPADEPAAGEAPSDEEQAAPAVTSLEAFLNDIQNAPDTKVLDVVLADAEKSLTGSALKAIKDAIKNRRDDMRDPA